MKTENNEIVHKARLKVLAWGGTKMLMGGVKSFCMGRTGLDVGDYPIPPY